ncbi:MAG: hypothetical protein AAB582_03075 [Patescibacteria group bacterium]
MNRSVAIGIVVVLALLAGGYLWYTNQPSAVPPQLSEQNVETPIAPSVAQIETSVVGTWRSVDDPKFTRAFGSDGRVTDRYAGNTDATTVGNFELDGDTVPAQVKAVADGSPVLSVVFPEESLFFLVKKLTADELELVYVGAAGTLRFERI